MWELVKLFRALANERRIQILNLLLREKMSVLDISQKIRLSFKSVSKHLQKLESVKLVRQKQEGKWVFYHLENKSAVFIKIILARCLDFIKK